MPQVMPAVFFGHGNPMNVLLRNPYTESWAAIGAGMPRPRLSSLRFGPLVHRGRSSNGEHRPEDNPRLRRVPPGTVPSAIASSRTLLRCCAWFQPRITGRALLVETVPH